MTAFRSSLFSRSRAGNASRVPRISSYRSRSSGRKIHYLTDPDTLRDFVADVGEQVIQQSDQQDLELEQISGNSGVGYIFDLSDESAAENEYKYLTQGALSVGNVILAFSLFSRDNHDKLRTETLEMLTTAVHMPGRRDVNFQPE